ncbi:thioredoxin I [Cryphonectria parasitica EP155]|uniref:Thioredoxin I n=1 Tax=Cryphonectria parasitica (strain ATCC 38755 / EP155) TaxID=660469 RepID=A0A9P5CKF2_CRYP1|nr:thioredoxin I [Cryphonectria parasitica EP155]KAF3760911.1 thioredoxin I [Cryphonectria parasitica EP155]
MAVQHVASHSDFQSLLDTTMYVVADFYADWCGPCKQIAPLYEQFAKASSVPGYLAFAKVNVDHNRQTAAQYGVSAMPTFMFFKNGKQVGVNGQPLIRGADVRSLKAAVDKLGGLAKEKHAAGAKVGE